MKAGVLGGEVFFSIAFFFLHELHCVVFVVLGCFLRSLS